MMSLQYFKFLYAIRMLDNGLSSSALYYLEQIASSIVKRPGEVLGERLDKFAFMDQVLNLCERLKFLDPMYTTREGEISDMGDPEWLMEFRNTVYICNNNGYIGGYQDQTEQQLQQQLSPEEQTQQQVEYIQQQQQEYYSGEYLSLIHI